MRDLALVINYSKSHSSVRGSGYLQLSPNNKFLFVDLHKNEQLSDRLKYQDKFMSPDRFQWQTPNTVTQKQPTGTDLIHHLAKDISLHLFVRKIKIIDGLTQPYLYLGTVNVMDYQGNRPITCQLQLHKPVSSQIYVELT